MKEIRLRQNSLLLLVKILLLYYHISLLVISRDLR
jgi:hypothetical protein